MGPVVAPPESFAVNGHHFALDQFAYLAHPGGEANTELLRVQETEDTPKCVVGPSVLWEEMPLGSFRNLANQSLLTLPNSYI